MNAINHLYKLSCQKHRYILGLMSGTSLDGLDIVLCRFEGYFTETKVTLLHFQTQDYTAIYRERIAQVFSKSQVDLQQLCLLNAWIGRYHASLVQTQLAEWGISPTQVDAIASHGQTIFHAPQSFHQQIDYPNATLQIGDGDHIAAQTGILTLSDFRQRQIAHGGEGAPLAIYGDFLLGTSSLENRILLNIGGIANMTFLPNSQEFSETICSDTGPGNTMIDAYVRKYFSPLTYDIDARIASKGKLDELLLKALLDHSYFSQRLPKTTGPEIFNFDYLFRAMQHSDRTTIAHEDVLYTLTFFTAQSIVYFINNYLPKVSVEIYASGGGYHNPLLRKLISEGLGKDIKASDDIGLDKDSKEAILFACLANETLSGKVNKSVKHAHFPWISMGKISFPN